jgi:hypothetical protein
LPPSTPPALPPMLSSPLPASPCWDAACGDSCTEMPSWTPFAQRFESVDTSILKHTTGLITPTTCYGSEKGSGLFADAELALPSSDSEAELMEGRSACVTPLAKSHADLVLSAPPGLGLTSDATGEQSTSRANPRALRLDCLL